MTASQYQQIHSASLPELARIYAAVWQENSIPVIRDFILNDRFFLLTQVLGVSVAWHPWVLERCREVEADPDEHLDLWSRGHFKSTIITYAGVIQYVLAHPEHAVCIMSYKAGAAEAFSAQIKAAFEHNEILLKCFPDILWAERDDHAGDQWTISEFSVKRKTNRKEATVSTSGLVSGMRTGGHFDLLVYDDVVTPESVTNPEMIRRTTDAWSMSLNLGTLHHTRHWYIGTRYALYDTYYEMLQRGTIKERRHICIDAQGRSVLLPQEELERKQKEMTAKDWASQMLQNPIGDGELLFSPDWFQTYTRLPSIPINYYIFGDTAQSSAAKADRTVIWVVGFAADGYYYVCDGVVDRLKQSQRTSAIFALAEKWQPLCVFWEENAAPDDEEVFREAMQTRGRFNLRSFRQKSNSGSKASRIETLEPLFRAGRILFPQRLVYRTILGQTLDLTQEFFKAEYSSFPQVLHDDMLDSLANLSAGNEDITPFLHFPSLKPPSAMAAIESSRMGSGRNSQDCIFAR